MGLRRRQAYLENCGLGLPVPQALNLPHDSSHQSLPSLLGKKPAERAEVCTSHQVVREVITSCNLDNAVLYLNIPTARADGSK